MQQGSGDAALLLCRLLWLFPPMMCVVYAVCCIGCNSDCSVGLMQQRTTSLYKQCVQRWNAAYLICSTSCTQGFLAEHGCGSKTQTFKHCIHVGRNAYTYIRNASECGVIWERFRGDFIFYYYSIILEVEFLLPEL